jgi:hypothetical protein
MNIPYGPSDPCLFGYEELERAKGKMKVVEKASETNSSI